MKTPPVKAAGAVLVFAVLLLAAGVFVLTGIAQLAATQAVVGQNEWAALNRRVTLENSRAMARQYVLSVMFSNVVPTNAVVYRNATLGGFSISNTAGPGAGLYWSYATTNAGQVINPFSPMERGGFYPGIARAGLISEITTAGTNVVDWTFVVRTRSPIAAGYSFVQHRPGAKVFGPDETRYVDATNFVKFPDMPQISVSSVTDTNQDGDGYQGFFSVPLGPANPSSFRNTNALQTDPQNPAEASILVNLDDDPAPDGDMPETGLAYRYVVDPSVTRLEIKGTLDGNNLAPLQIVATNNPDLTNVVLSGNNPRGSGRRVYFHYRFMGGPPLRFDFQEVSDDWRFALSVKNASAGNPSADLGGLTNRSLVGGIRTDGDILPASGVPVAFESDPQGLDYVADQMMWLEDYRAP